MAIYASFRNVPARQTEAQRKRAKMRRWLRDFATREHYEAWVEHQGFDGPARQLLESLLPKRLRAN